METLGKEVKKEAKKSIVPKSIFISDYNPRWPIFFQEEAAKIKSFMMDDFIDIYHVGSTSVPGLSAKPIIDIILVTNDLEKTKSYLTSSNLLYRYKGEYNLPLRDLYGKQGEYEIYLHVHKKGSPEIKLNLLFSEFLRNNKNIRKKYEAVKINASNTQGSEEKVSTGITQYNLMKNAVIVSILREAGFNELCVRFATQNVECETFSQIRSSFFSDIQLVDNAACLSGETKKFVLYRGSDIIGAACLSDLGLGRFSIDFLLTKDENIDGFFKLLTVIEEWIKERKHDGSLFAIALKEQQELYLSLGFRLVTGKHIFYLMSKSLCS